MSTPSIPVPGRRLAADVNLRATLRRLLSGAQSDPVWSRPALIAVAVLAAVLMLWGLSANGDANSYYASAVYSASRSWSAFFYNALDLSGYVSVDKTPLSIWMMAVSARVFGFSSFSMLLPDAVCGIASVLVLHNTVKRTLGPRVAIIAALMLALTPAVVVMARFNNPDALLMLLLVCSAWAVVRALESGATRYVVLCGVLVGLAFNTKMLQAYLVVPALAAALLLAAPGSLRRRFTQLLAGGLAMAAVSAAWVGTMMLIPAADRPYVGDSTSNSWWQLIFGANGFDRVGSSSGGGGPGGAGGFGGGQGALRLFNDQLGGQIAWLLPLAAVGLVVGLLVRRRVRRTDRARAAVVLWGAWAAVHYYVFSFSLNLFHPYYASALAPAIAVLAALGVVELWSRSRESAAAAALLAIAVGGTGLLAFSLLGRTPSFVPWLRWPLLAGALAAAIGVAALRIVPRRLARLSFAIAGLGLAAMLAAPVAYSVATATHSIKGGNPIAGPAAGGEGLRFGGPPGAGRLPAGLVPPPGAGFPPGPGGGPPPGLGFRGARGGPGGLGGEVANKQLIAFLEAHRGTAKYLVAASGSMTAAPIILATHQPVITMGGFGGGDPAPTIGQLQGLLRSGQVRYVLVGPNRPGGPRGGRPAGGPPGIGGGSSQARDSWITSRCTAVSYSGSSPVGQSVYDCSRAV